ncbi:MAG: alpha/beta hydrolase [Saprospiraceae bacterium]|nr:alpha/beta hydrolase [Saprospiraceae bacterium]
MKYLILNILALIAICSVCAQTEPFTIPLYPGAIPNSKKVPDTERTEFRATGGRFIYDTAIPTLTIYQAATPNGKAVIICPGGGYRGTAIDKEGFLVAQTLAADSITAFVLKYRIPNDSTNIDKSLAPLQDAQQAIRYVRRNAGRYGVDASRIGIMGFSAGGHLAASAATRFQTLADPTEQDSISVRPDFAILIYPVISFTDTLMHRGSRENLLGKYPSEAEIMLCSAEKQVDPSTPPTFLVHAADDRAVPVGNSIAYYTACVENGVAAEMHLYPRGGHGFGLFNTTTPDNWMDRLKNWLTTL